ncbi:MAG: AsnC family transcriptional regulator [Rhodospirillales bacterium]|nr:AsnC family transcriptional regulator [Rhodospirillales bacterium]
MLGPELDSRLIHLLMQNARLSNSELSRRLGVSRSTVQARIERLELTGAILGYTLRLNPARDQHVVQAHVSISVSPKLQAAVERHLLKLRGVGTLYATSGADDLIAIVHADSMAELDQCLDAIRDTDGVLDTRSAIILSTRMPRGG